MNSFKVFRLLWAMGGLGSLQPLSAQATLVPSADARPRQQADPTSANAADSNRLGVGPVKGSDDFFRTYLAFDLSNEAPATAVTLTLPSANAPENNTASGFTQNFTVFRVASDWDGVSPLPDGTDLASTQVTLNPVATSGVSLSFSSAALTTAFNDAIGGTLYLGVYSPEGEAASPDTRSFLWLTSTESSIDGGGTNPAPQPSLTYSSGPLEPIVLASYEFNGGSPAATVQADGVTASAFTIDDALLNAGFSSSGNNLFARVNGTTAETLNEALAGDQFVSVTIAPGEGLNLGLANLTLDLGYSVNATSVPGGLEKSLSASVFSSADGFTTPAVLDTATVASTVDTTAEEATTIYQTLDIDLSGAAYQNLTEPIEFRIYFYDNEDVLSQPIHRVDDFILTGIVASGPVAAVLRDLTYDPITGNAQIIIEGTPEGRYQLEEATGLDFSTPDQDPVVLTSVTIGSLDGNVIVLDEAGTATVEFNLGAGKTVSFLRAKAAP